MDGSLIIGSEFVGGGERFAAVAPASGDTLAPTFVIASPADVARACTLAEAAFDRFRETSPTDRAAFLEEVAARIEAIGEPLIERAMQESGLPKARLTGERARTIGQLRLFAQTLRDGRWAGVTMDTPLPDRAPLPRADLRQRRIAIGPVAVFGASNFPLAFSVAGGDTASAWAAGCPVVVKGHPAHPGTSELVGRAIRAAISACGLPEGVFSLLQGPGNDLGAALVADPRIKAVGFTGSRTGGLALVDIAARRPEPIPVFAEMSSINPVILFPAALAARGETLATGYVASLTMGSGQFCTNPGVVLAVAGPELDAFIAAAKTALEQAQPQVMLTGGIHAAYGSGVEALAAHAAVDMIARGVEGTGCTHGRAALFATDAASFLGDAALGHEIFGAASIIVRCDSIDQIADRHREHGGPADRDAADRPERRTRCRAPDPAAGAQGGTHPRQWVADRGRSVDRDGSWRPLSRDLGRAFDVGRHRRDRAVPAPGLLSGPARVTPPSSESAATIPLACPARSTGTSTDASTLTALERLQQIGAHPLGPFDTRGTQHPACRLGKMVADVIGCLTENIMVEPRAPRRLFR